jgi:transcriptional regulator with XRE-family HTH domain
MGTSRRPRPARLAEKLLRIRQELGLSQSQMCARLAGADVNLVAPYISLYESGKREPPLQTLLAYARAAGVLVELLIDDDTELPPRLPAGRSVWVLQDGRLWQQKSGRRR